MQNGHYVVHVPSIPGWHGRVVVALRKWHDGPYWVVWFAGKPHDFGDGRLGAEFLILGDTSVREA